MSQEHCWLFFRFLFDSVLLETSYLQVQLLQSSDQRGSNLKTDDEQTVVENNIISFHHMETDYAKMITAYIDTVTSNNHLFLF